MYDAIKEILFFFIIINPVSKIILVNSLPSKIHKHEIQKLLLKAGFIGIGLLITFAFTGTFILTNIFQIDIYALQIAGGIILAIVGFRALDKGIFFNQKNHKCLVEMAIVPLASPLIAGPATLAAVITKSSIYNPTFVSFTVSIAVILNIILSLFSLKIKTILDKFNLMGALIRLTGLFIMSIGMHMIFESFRFFL